MTFLRQRRWALLGALLAAAPSWSLVPRVGLRRRPTWARFATEEKPMAELDDGEVSAGRQQRDDAEASGAEGLWVGPPGRQLRIFSGDFVVHPSFGIGKFLGMSKQELGKLVLQMADGDLALTAQQAEALTRYRSGEEDGGSKRVVLGSIDDDRRWKKKLDKVAVKTEELALEVVSLYAERRSVTRPPCALDGPTMRAFDAAFEHQPTPDQITCFQDVEVDMCWRAQPMDRLICGDVGFGKTEVAMRAIYRAWLNGRQCAVLAPTTVLAAQHLRTLNARMAGDINVQLLTSRLRPKDAAGVRAGVANGTVDVVIGTHAILSGKVQFANLKLLVIDEEQRFGVSHKERLKGLSEGLDVLTLSATPIPRTLQMGLAGMRDMSTILTPPPERKEITTAVNIFNETLVQMVVNHEMKRGGQSIYVVPRINDIEAAEAMLNRVVPKARILVAHGRQRNLQDIVVNFAEGSADVLIATTVVENGIDIPTVNSLIVESAQMFGLSSLYQLRGRVGRRNINGIALFLYPGKKALTTDALRRLLALKELGLGSGFDLAHRDLEIRGAGSVIGRKQSGFISDVGYDLYCDMFTNAVKTLRGSAILPSPYVVSSVKGIPNLDQEVQQSLEEALEPTLFEKLRLATSFSDLRDLSAEALARVGDGDAARIEAIKTALKASHIRVGCLNVGAISLDAAKDLPGGVVLTIPELTEEMWQSWQKGLGGEKLAAFSYVPAESTEKVGVTKDGVREVVHPRLVVAGVAKLPIKKRSEGLLKLLLPLVTFVGKESREAMRRFQDINEELKVKAAEAEAAAPKPPRKPTGRKFDGDRRSLMKIQPYNGGDAQF